MDPFHSLTLHFFFFFFVAGQVSSDHFISSSLRGRFPQQYFELTRPLPSGQPDPECYRLILNHSFAHTINSPPYSVPYTPPSGCPFPWTRVVLDFTATCKGEQYDRIAGLWLGGVELLRTSTAQPTDSGVFWTVRKDVSRYFSLLVSSGLNFTMMLENIVNDVYTGVYHVNVTLSYYRSNLAQIPSVQGLNRRLRILGEEESGLDSEGFGGIRKIQSDNDMENYMFQGSAGVYKSPPDKIIPICDDGDYGFWYRIGGERDLHSKKIQIPKNTYRAVLELYVSFHGNDEFWYSNPPDSYIRMNNLSTARGNGGYREVYVTIDGENVGFEVPFPVIFTGGINPLFWEPIVSIGAFNLPSYDINLTPFLGLILDGKSHSFEIGVAKGISYWLVNANLHLWLDPYSSVVEAKQIVYEKPQVKIESSTEIRGRDGLFEIEAERQTQTQGWVKWSAGNFTTIIVQQFQFRSSIQYQRNGTYTTVKQKIKDRKNVLIKNNMGQRVFSSKFKRKFPLQLITSTGPGSSSVRYVLVTNVSHGKNEKYSSGCFSYSIHNNQQSQGWMEVEDHSVVSGDANTRQSYRYSDKSLNCYSRRISAANGRINGDNSSFSCVSSI